MKINPAKGVTAHLPDGQIVHHKPSMKHSSLGESTINSTVPMNRSQLESQRAAEMKGDDSRMAETKTMNFYPVDDRKISVRDDEVIGQKDGPSIPDRNSKPNSKYFNNSAPQSAMDVINTKSDLSPVQFLNNENDQSEV